MRFFCILLLVGFTVLASQNWFEHQAALQQAATLHNASLHKVVSMFSPATVPPLGWSALSKKASVKIPTIAHPGPDGERHKRVGRSSAKSASSQILTRSWASRLWQA
jgi:hypothetical protein